MKQKILFLFFYFVAFYSFAQEQTTKIEMADSLRESGKIYVVIGVLITIFTGIIIFLINMDRKLSRLEKEIKK